MKTTFLYNSPHLVNESWAKSINAVFIGDRVDGIPNISRFFKSFQTLKKIPKDTNLLLCEGGSQIFTGALWKSKNKNKKLGLIVSEPKFHYIPKMSFLKRKFYETCLNKFDLFICTTPYIQSFVEKYSGKKVIVPVFADVKKFSKLKPSFKKNICYAGRLSKEKGADLTINTFKLVRDSFSKSKLYMPGHGITEEIKKLVDKNIILPGRVNNIEKYYKECSIYLALARADAANISVLEAMNASLIPIVSENVGNKFIVSQVNDELIVNNPIEASRLIKKLWNDKKLLKKYSHKCKLIAKKYDEKNSVKIFKKNYKFSLPV